MILPIVIKLYVPNRNQNKQFLRVQFLSTNNGFKNAALVQELRYQVKFFEEILIFFKEKENESVTL
jgi:hypothetical protein